MSRQFEMYQEITEADLTTRLTAVDKFLNSGTEVSKNLVKELLKFIHTTFPLDYVMPTDFKGTHCITLKPDGKLQVSVWCNGKVYDIWED